jgi:hypothetical protein
MRTERWQLADKLQTAVTEFGLRLAALHLSPLEKSQMTF